MNEKLKIGGCYKGKNEFEGSWFLCSGIYKDYYTGRFCFVDEDGTDEEILDVGFDKVEGWMDTSRCWSPKYHKKYGLYKVYDDATGEEIILQLNLRRKSEENKRSYSNEC